MTKSSKHILNICLLVTPLISLLECTQPSHRNAVKNTEYVCDSNYLFSLADSLLYVKLSISDNNWLTHQPDTHSSDLVIGANAIYETLCGNYKQALTMLPHCLVQRFYTNRFGYERFDYALGYFQNFAIWLNYFLNESTDSDEALRLFFNISFQNRHLPEVARLEDTIESFLTAEGRNTIHISNDFESTPFDAWFEFLIIYSNYLKDKDDHKYFDSLLFLSEKNTLMKEFTLRTAINVALKNAPKWCTLDSIKQLIYKHDSIRSESCLFAKIVYADLLDINRISSCRDCISKGGMIDSLLAFAYLANEISTLESVDTFIHLLEIHETRSGTSDLQIPKNILNIEYGLILEAKLKYCLITDNLTKFWNLCDGMRANPIVSPAIRSDLLWTEKYIKELHNSIGFDSLNFNELYDRLIKAKN